jgi:hypothetical protein
MILVLRNNSFVSLYESVRNGALSVYSSNILKDFNIGQRFVFFVKLTDIIYSFVYWPCNIKLFDIVDRITSLKVLLVSSSG